MDGMGKAGQAVAGRQFSLASLLLVTLVVGIVLGLGRIIVPAAMAVAPADLSLFGWMAGLAAFAVAVIGIFVYANR